MISSNEKPVTIIGEAHNKDLGRIYLISMMQALDAETAKNTILLIENITYEPRRGSLNPESRQVQHITESDGPFSYASLVEVANKKGVQVFGLEDAMKSMRFDPDKDLTKRLGKNPDWKNSIDDCRKAFGPSKVLCLIGNAHVHTDLSDQKVTGLAELCSDYAQATYVTDDVGKNISTVQHIQMQDPRDALKSALAKNQIYPNNMQYIKNENTENWELRIPIREDKKTNKTMNTILSSIADIKGITGRMDGINFTIEFTDLGQAPEALKALTNILNPGMNEKLTVKQSNKVKQPNTNKPKSSLFNLFKSKESKAETEATKNKIDSPQGNKDISPHKK